MGHQQSKTIIETSSFVTELLEQLESTEEGTLEPSPSPLNSAPASQSEESQRNFAEDVIGRILQISTGNSNDVQADSFMSDGRDPSISDISVSNVESSNEYFSDNLTDSITNCSVYTDVSGEYSTPEESMSTVKSFTFHTEICPASYYENPNRSNFLSSVDVDTISFTPLDSSSRNSLVDDCNGGLKEGGEAENGLVEIDLKSETTHYSTASNANVETEEKDKDTETKKFINRFIKKGE